MIGRYKHLNKKNINKYGFKKSLFKLTPLGVRSLYLSYTLYNRVPSRRRNSTINKKIYLRLFLNFLVTKFSKKLSKLKNNKQTKNNFKIYIYLINFQYHYRRTPSNLLKPGFNLVWSLIFAICAFKFKSILFILNKILAHEANTYFPMLAG